jgi:hypothetical protein
MPAAGVAGQLTEAHRLAQVRLGVVTVRQMLAVFHILDPDDIDGTFPDWLTAVAPIVQAQRRSSAELAGRYLAVSRALQVGIDSAFAPTIAAPVNLEQLLTSMLVTGPVTIRADWRDSYPSIARSTSPKAEPPPRRCAMFSTAAARPSRRP